MPFTDDNNFEVPTSGVADWDSPLNSNLQAIARGFEFKATAGAAVNTGDAVSLTGSGFVLPVNANSMDGPRPIGVSRTSMTSGSEAQFMTFGVIRSMTVFSGNITAGERVYVNPASIGMLTTSKAAAQWPVGWALDQNAVMVNVQQQRFPELISDVRCGEAVVNSWFSFDMDLGHRGFARTLRVITNSVDAYRVQFWSGSSRVSSELLFATKTTSVDGGAQDFDITSLNWLDGAGWPYIGTDVASPALIYGRITVQSAATVSSGTFHVAVTGERFF